MVEIKPAVFAELLCHPDRQTDGQIDRYIDTIDSYSPSVLGKDKQCKPRLDSAERGVLSWSPVFAYTNFY